MTFTNTTLCNVDIFLNWLHIKKRFLISGAMYVHIRNEGFTTLNESLRTNVDLLAGRSAADISEYMHKVT